MLQASRSTGAAATTTRGRRRPGEALRRFLRALDEFVVVEHTVAGRKMSARRPRRLAESGTCVVLVAGLGLSGRYLLPVAHELAPRLPVWVPDLPGFGRSASRDKVLDMAGLGDALVAWMNAVGIDFAALVGNSMGCQIAVEAAARHPHRISSVVLEGPTMDAAARSVVRHAGRVAVDAFREPLSLGPLQVFDWLGTGPRRLVATTRYAFAHRVEERAKEVACPVLVVRGSRDPIVPQRWAEQMADALASGTLTVVSGGTHAMTYSNPVTLAEIVDTFVRKGTT